MKQEKFDVAIIGSGIAGMTAAAMLANGGYQVLVVERLPMLGGRCADVEYKGYKLPTGVLWVSDDYHGRILREVGADFEIRVPEPQYYYRMEGKDYAMPEKGGLRAMVGLASQDESEAARVMNAMRRGLSWQEPSDAISLQEWLGQFTQNPKVLGVFQVLTTMSAGITNEELPAGEYIRYIKNMANIRRYGFVPGGSVNIIRALARVVEAKGGQVRTRARVLRVLLEGGVAKGVVVHQPDGEVQVSAQAVLSNVGPKKTVALAGRENFDIGYLKHLDITLKSAPQILIFVTSDRPLCEYPGILFLTESRRVLAIFNKGILNPELSPPGKYLLEAGAFFTRSSPPYDLKKELELSLQDLRENLPGFDEHGEVLMACCYHGEWPIMRSWAGYNIPQKTPIENLYNVGDGVSPPGWWGSPGAMESARIVVEDVTRRFKPGAA
jgi:phytoene dehydrogenase-like protein